MEKDGKSISHVTNGSQSSQHQHHHENMITQSNHYQQYISHPSSTHASGTIQCELSPPTNSLNYPIQNNHPYEQASSCLLTTHSVSAPNKWLENDISRMNSSIYTYDLNQYSPMPNKTSEPSSLTHSAGELSINEDEQRSIEITACKQSQFQPSIVNTTDKGGQFVHQQVYNHDGPKNREDWLPKPEHQAYTIPKYQSNSHSTAKKESEFSQIHSKNWFHKLDNHENNKGSTPRSLTEEIDESPCSSTMQYCSSTHPLIDNNIALQKNTLNYMDSRVNHSNNIVNNNYQQDHYMSKNNDKRLNSNIFPPLTTTSSCTTTTTSNSTSETNQQVMTSTLSNTCTSSSSSLNYQHAPQHMYSPPQQPLPYTTPSSSSIQSSCSASSSNQSSSSGGEENSTTSEKVQSSNTKTSNQTNSTKIKTPRKKYRRSLCIEERDLLRVLHLPQTQACSSLGCSLSTLKRRFYELKDKIGIDKWPQFYNDIRHLDAFPHIYPMSLEFVMNEVPVHEKFISTACMVALTKAFECSKLAKPSQKGYSKLIFADPSHGISKRKKK